jgi:hypothetical protein
MRKSRMVCTMAAAALCAIAVSCGKKDTNPVKPPDQPLGNVILSEGFEGDLSNYRQITYAPEQGLMSISTQHPKTGSGSLTSDSNNTGIKKLLEPSINDSIAGLQFYLMATQTSHTNFIAALCKPGSSANGLFAIYGMGIDQSDSLKYVFENAPGDIINEHKNFAALTLDKWYKCKIEYNYTDTTLTYFLDNDTIYTRTAPNPMTLQIFVVMRDGLGAQGPSGYYIDDVTIYKR